MKRFLVLFLVPPLLLGLAPARCQPPPVSSGQARLPRLSEDVPADSWAYGDQYVLADANIPGAYHYSGGSRRAWSRAEFAKGIGAMAAPLMGLDRSARQDLLTLLRLNPPALDAMFRLVDEFGPELEAQGQDVPAIQKELVSLAETMPTSGVNFPPLDAVSADTVGLSLIVAPPFPDVPKDHWAYAAVEVLRKAGLVVGEPGDVYRRVAD